MKVRLPCVSFFDLEFSIEGESIAFEVIDVCTQVNPNIISLRAFFSAVSDEEIHNALKSLHSPNPNYAAAVQARMELDLRVGAAFTRFQTLRLMNKIPELQQQIISFGIHMNSIN